MNGERKISRNLWRGLTVITVLMPLSAVLLVTLVALGVFDPKPLGPLSVSQSLQRIRVDQDSEPTLWLEDVQPEGDFSIRVSARLAEGESDIGYGLVLGGSQEELIFALSPLGYLTFWRQLEKNGTLGEELYIPWRTWPHIHTGNEPNEIWLDVQDGRLTSIRVNSELLDYTPVSVPGEQIGLWSKTFGEPAEIGFDSLEIFSDSK